MPRTFTLTQMRDKVRRRADQESVGFITNDELTDYINSSLAELHEILIMEDCAYFEAEQTITGTGVATYALPTTFFATQMVERVDGTSYIPLKPIDAGERHLYPGTGTAAAYRVTGSNLELLPAPTSGTYRHTYVAYPTLLSADGDTVDGHMGWEEWIVVDCAIKCHIKEDSTPRALMAERDRITERIVTAAKARMMRHGGRVNEVRDDGWDEGRRSLYWGV